VQVPVVVDAPPQAHRDLLSVPMGEHSMLHVLDNDDVAHGALALAAVVPSPNALASLCANASCILYTPRFRFSGHDEVTYTAVDGRGRATAARALVRLSTAAPALQNLPHVLNLRQGAPAQPLASLRVAYDDLTWRLDALVRVRLPVSALPAAQWPPAVLHLPPALAPTLSLAASDAAAGAPHVEARLSGNVTTLAATLPQLLLALPPSHCGAALLELGICSEWGECSVRHAAPGVVAVGTPLYACVQWGLP
jgi:Bacterial Ig domain